MGQKICLSSELSRSRALLAGGAAPLEVLELIRRWQLCASVRGTRKVAKPLVRWSQNLSDVIGDAIPWGSSIGELLRAVQPMVKREERSYAKLQALERQFGFQGAIALVLPWVVASIIGGFNANAFTLGGLVFQGLGLILFYILLKKALKSQSMANRESEWIFECLTTVWMRVIAGSSLYTALSAGFKAHGGIAFSVQWKNWLLSREGNAIESAFRWPAEMPGSAMIAAFLDPLLKSGAPAAEALASLVQQIDDDRQAALEERLAALPTKFSLVFCGCFAPAVFLILLGALWPMFNSITL